MAPMTNRVQVWLYILGLTIETNNFTFEVKVILGLESTIPEGRPGRPACPTAGRPEMLGLEPASAQLELGLRLSLANIVYQKVQ